MGDRETPRPGVAKHPLDPPSVSTARAVLDEAVAHDRHRTLEERAWQLVGLLALQGGEQVFPRR